MSRFPVRCQWCKWSGDMEGKPYHYPPCHNRPFPGVCPECGKALLVLDLASGVTEAMTWPEDTDRIVDD